MTSRPATRSIRPRILSKTSESLRHDAVVNQLGIGPAGELLVQYKLLKHDIDSSRMTVDDGIDLVMYLSRTREPATIQVKTNVKPNPDFSRDLA